MLDVRNLSKTFTLHILGGKVIEGFSGVSFRVTPGEFLGLAGRSGSGKSSVLKCIYGTYLPTTGETWFDSARCGRVNLASCAEQTILQVRNSEMGYVSQFLRVIPRVAAVDVVAEPLLRLGEDPAEARRRASALLERLKIPAKLHDTYPATFSGGEQQRINIARAVIWEPRLLLLDEPTASLDRESQDIVLGLLRELKRKGTSMIGIFHDRASMEAIADRVLEMSNGNREHGPH
ncbi:MAG: Alpha-D-ribose 1-methylphosphonate 5-triphosphate synthase subunit PhnL [Syntrophaceae bacterium PtaB.Bin038]|jgi:alpha-D-ribose 1-methylphosphonate 5-triphosphate synthase subunit PhnL|nr:MAG: Alpha-D-ribose 1-methylphosphonate 5-triphosphate synthase subunit PhnL [Syntrophaceae bacterium PtaB.Bin038]